MNRILLSLAASFGALMPLIFDSALKGAALLAVAALTALAMRCASAAARHLVWLVAVVALLVVPLLSVALPQWRVLPKWAASPLVAAAPAPAANAVTRTAAPHPIPEPSPATPPAPQPQSAGPVTPPPAAAPLPPSAPSSLAPLPSEETARSWHDWLPLVWVAGCALLVLRLLAAHWLLRRAARGCLPLTAPPDEAITAAFATACAQLGVRPRVRLLLDARPTIPVVWGVFRPRLLLPAEAREWNHEQLRSVLLHELSHLKRRDPLVQWLTQIACALHWWNPLVWLAAWRLHAERERACDDLVLASGVRPSAYAEHLLQVATKLSPARWTAACGLAMARKSSLEGRLLAVLSDRLNRRAVTGALAATALLLGAGLAIPLAMLRAAEAEKPETDAEVAHVNAEPNDPRSKALFENWKAGARSDGRIPGGRIGEMAASLKTFMDLNPGHEQSVKLEPLLEKCDASRDWPPAEAAALLDEIAAVSSQAEWTMRGITERRIHPGKPLPDELATAPWGQPAANGLRMAWLLEPRAETQALDSVMKSRVLFHNTGKAPVCFATEDWIQSGGHKAKDADGKDISVWAVSRMGIRLPMNFRLAPGEYAEVEGHGLGVGSHETSSEKSIYQVGCWIEAKEGDLVTFTPGNLQVTFQTWINNEGLKDSVTVWNEMIAARVLREGPMPAFAADRELLLRRVMQDFPGTAPTAEEIAAFAADNAPDALQKLTARLQTRSAAMHFGGELSGGETKFRVTAAEAKEKPEQGADAGVQPKHEYAQSLFQKWQARARTDGKIPGALLGHVARELDSFLKQHPEHEGAPQLAALRPRLDASRDWTQEEVVALLDEITAVATAPVSWADLPMEFSAMRFVRGGQPLPGELESASWGPPAENGLRAAWLLEPRAEQYPLGSVLKARVLFHNAGIAPVLFKTETWHQYDGHTARDAAGAEIKVSGPRYSGITPMATFRLAPGGYCEVLGHGIAIGAGEYAEERSIGSVGAIIEAKEGETVTLSHSVDAAQGGWTRPGDPKDPAELWKATIAERVANEAPMPAAPADREQLIRRVTLDMLGVVPTADEIAAFIADDAPDALANLTARLQAKPRIEPWAGTLPTGETKFVVVAADPNAAKAPRTATAPGRYVLGDGVHLQVTQTTNGGKRTNKASILFLSPDPKVASPHQPYEIELAADFAFVWEKRSRKLWVTDISDGERLPIWLDSPDPADQSYPGPKKVMVRAFDFADPADVKLTHISTSENGGGWSWGKLIPEPFQQPVIQALGEKGKRLLDFVEPQKGEKTAAAGTPKRPKLLDEAYTKTGVHCQKFREEDARRPGGELMGEVAEPMPAEGDEGPLVLGLRVASDAKWIIGGEARVELVVRNASGSDVKFAQTPRSDNGLSVVAIDKDGKEHAAYIAQFDSWLTFNRLLLPPAHVVTVKSFTLRFDSEKKGVSEPGVAACHLPPGDYTLRCKWNDARPEVAHEGEWTGELVSVDHKFTLTAGGAPASETPKTTEKEAFTAWGMELSGLQAGVGFRPGEKRAYRHGETVGLVIRVRNVGTKEVSFQYLRQFFAETAPAVTDGEGKSVPLEGFPTAFGHHIPREVKLAPGKEIELYELKLKPRPASEVGIAPLKEEGPEAMVQRIWASGKVGVQYKRILGNSSSGQLKNDPALSELATGKLELEIEPGAPVQQEVHKQQNGAMLKPATEQKLKWGEPANGLRMALAWPPTLGEPAMGDAPEFYLVVQNVSETAVRLAAGDDAPNPRRLMMRENGRPLQAISDPVPTPGDWLLQPREVAFLRLYQSNANWKDGRTVSSAIEQDIRTVPRYSMTAEMTIEKAPAGAWTGKLVTGQTRGSADVISPKHKDAQALYKSWTTASRANGDIPGALIGLLAESVKLFIKSNPRWETVPQLEKMLPRFDASHDWAGQDAVALLDELAAVQDSPVTMALDVENAGIIRTGAPLPPELTDAPWGGSLPNGLRHAWLLEPRAREHRLGTALKARVLLHNSGEAPVVFRTRTWHQPGYRATDAEGAEIKTEATDWMTRGLLLTYRLAPDEFVELSGPGIGIGPKGDPEDWQQTRVGTWIEAKAGDEVTVMPGLLSLMEDVPNGPMRWWHDHVSARLARHLPFPADADARLRLLHRVAIEVLGTSVSKKINDSFVADTTPTALDSVAHHLTGFGGLLPFVGTRGSAPTKFRVLPADPDAANRPRSVSGPGHYTLGENVRLVVTRRAVGERIVNEGSVTYFPPGADNIVHDLELPDGYGTWAAAWVRGDSSIWVTQKGLLRRIEFANPAKVEETRYEGDQAAAAPIPAGLLEAHRAALAEPDAPKQRYEPLKPGAPAAAPPKPEPAQPEAPKTATPAGRIDWKQELIREYGPEFVLGNDFTEPFEGDELTLLAKTPATAPHRLKFLILRAAAAKDVRFRYLLNDPEVARIPDAVRPLKAYDFSVNGNARSLAALLEEIVASSDTGGSWEAGYALAYVNEWERSIPVVTKHNSGDGAGYEEWILFWLTRNCLFPDEYDRYFDGHPEIAKYGARRRAPSANGPMTEDWPQDEKPNTTGQAMRLAAAPNKSEEDIRQLRQLILQASVQKATELRPLLKDEELKRSDHGVALALAAYDYSVNGNKAGLQYVLDEMAIETDDRDENAAWTLAWIDEWDLSMTAYDKHLSRIAGSQAEFGAVIWETRERLFPESYARHFAKELAEAKLDAASLRGVWKGTKDGMSVELRFGDKNEWDIRHGGENFSKAELKTHTPPGASVVELKIQKVSKEGIFFTYGWLKRGSDDSLHLHLWQPRSEASPDRPQAVELVVTKEDNQSSPASLPKVSHGPKPAEASQPAAPAPGSLQPITDGRSSAHVLRAVGHEPVVILTGRALTASPDSTSREGSVTMEVATSDKTETIRYTWPEDAPGFLDLELGGRGVFRFDLSRGRVFFVHFEKLEFSADVFQVPAGVKVPAITSPETLTEAAAAVAAWHAASDDRALWERSRIVVPESEYKPGQPLDAAAEKIVWGEANEAGLRLGLGGLEPGASFPVGQQLPVKQYIRNDSTKAITFSPTQIFNEGVGGELVRTVDGKKFPHQKGYRWQMFFDRVRLAPGHYIALGSGPMGTTMAEKDGSSPGGMGMMAHGFTVLPGEYTLQVTHGIGQFLGRPVNMNFGDPRGAPGLGEWTGVLKSAAVPLRLVDEQVKTARAGGSEAFGTRYMIAFDKGVLKLRHYNGYPNMALTGGPWEDGSRDWKIPAADGDYVAAWTVGGKGVWVKDASGITHLIVKENLTETGRWTLDQAAGGLGGMPAGVRAALQLPPSAAPQTFDFKKLPNAPGAAKISGDFFEMALSPGTVLKVPHGRREFFIEIGGSAYGPAEGNPVVELGLTELLRTRLTETPNTAGLDMLRHMIADGRGAIRDCGFRLLADLKAPQTPNDYDAVFHAMIHASIEDEDGPRELSPEARMGYTWFHNLFHTTRREWERTRPLLAAGRYQAGETPGTDPAIVWTQGPDGLSLGVSGLPAGTNLEVGKSVPVAVYLRNDSTAPVKLSVPSEHNPGIQISLTDGAGTTHRAIYPFSPPLTGYSHHELAPGTGAKVAAFDLEACATPEEADRAEHKEGKAHNPRLAVPPGSYELHLEYRNYQENPVPKGAASEWTGKVTAKPVPMKVAAATPTQQPAP